jgi:hypothetical protein
MERTIYFRGIDLTEISGKYNLGEFQNSNISLFSKELVVRNTSSNVLSQNSNNSKNKPYIGKLGNETDYICLGYITYDKEGNYKPIDPNRIHNCMYCLQKIEKNTDYFGLPIKRTVNEADGRISYHALDIFCCWDCAYAEYHERSNNSLYENTLIYMQELFTLSTGKPSNEMKKASDRRCLQLFNGPLTWEEFHKSSIKFSKKPITVLYFPVIYYIAQDSNKT